MACIYLIQPKEYIGTGTCKVGMSRKNDLQRVKSYGIGTRYLCIMECEDPFVLEKQIIKEFNEKYCKTSGNEYFCHCGNEDKMIGLFINIVLEHKKKIIRVLVDIAVEKRLKELKELKDYLTDSDSEEVGGSDVRSFFKKNINYDY